MKIEIDIAEKSLEDIVCTSLKKFIRNGYVEDKKLLKAMKRVLQFYSVHEDYVDFINDLKDRKI
jgi:hypothetical protein